MTYIRRHLWERVLFGLQHNPIIFLNGPRQAGKSTMARSLAKKAYPADYLSFDDPTRLGAAASSPESFLSQYNGAVIIDEVQMVPELFRALKVTVDELRLQDKVHSNGKFLLTGSANIMALPHLSEPLVGRMNVKTLYPFAGCEVLQGNGDFITRLFSAEFSVTSDSYSLNDVIYKATFPEISGKDTHEANEWFDGYITTILQRDARFIAEIEKITLLPRMLQVLAARAGRLINDADIARDMGLNPVTSKRYRSILQAMFLTIDVNPWYRNIGKRLVKSAKGYLLDTLLLCYLLDCDLDNMKQSKPHLYGHIVENFVASELIKLLSFTQQRANLFHFRTSDNKEVDFVLEKSDGTIAGIEVKSASRVNVSDFKGLNVLQAMTERDFMCGVVLYNGKDVVKFGDKLFAVPLSTLWQ